MVDQGVTSEAYFAYDGDRFIPSRFAKGGWGESLSGHVVGGLLGWAVEGAVDDPEWQPARLTVDLPRPTALEPIEVRTRVLRDGRRLRLVEATLNQRGTEVARASALFLRRCEQPAGEVWSQEVSMPPIPPEEEVADAALFVRTYGWGAPVQNPESGWVGETGAKYTWLHLVQQLVDGQPLTAFTRAAMAGDITASLANWGTGGLEFINADYTVTLSRLPEGPVLGLASHSHYSDAGVATGSATLVDARGPVGTCVAVALAHSGFRPPSP
nr:MULTISPECIES: thioesterase family protein [unclassified Mycobacterium]